MKLTKIKQNTWIKSAEKSDTHTQAFKKLTKEMRELGYGDLNITPIHTTNPEQMIGLDLILKDDEGVGIDWEKEILLIIKTNGNKD